MDGEFSLLKHLKVKVDSPATSQAKESAPTQRPRPHHEERTPCRTWSPAALPPGSNLHASRAKPRQGAGTHQQGRNEQGPRYADPTGEIIRTKKKGETVEYVVYDSKIPSIHGVNRQLAEQKRREAEAERAANAAAAFAPGQGYFGPSEEDLSRDDVRRRRLLDELQRCNMEQAQRRREEAAREERQRMQREADLVRQMEERMAAEREREREAKLATQRALREAAEQAAAERLEREAARHAEEQAEAALDYMSFVPGMRQTSRAASEQAEKEQRIAEENRTLAEERAARRRAEAAQEREEARRANELALEAMREENERRLVERERTRDAFERFAVEAAQKRQQAREEAECRRSQSWVIPPFATDDDRALQKRAQQFKEDQAVNKRLAEQRRAREREEAEADRRFAEEQIRRGKLAALREQELERARKLEQQAAMRAAAENIARERAHRVVADKEEAMVSTYWDHREEDEAHRRELREKQLRADLERQAEEKRQQRRREAEREKEIDRLFIEQAQRAADRDERQRKALQDRQRAQLQKELDEQIANRNHRNEIPAQVPFSMAVAPERRVLYRCPVTHELFPASEFDFGRSH